MNESKPTRDSDVAAIRRVRVAVEEAERHLDAEALSKLFTEDIAMLPPDNRIKGAAQVEQFHRELYQELQNLNVDFQIEQIQVLGDLAIETGTYTFQSVRRNGTESQGGGQYIYTYERLPTGGWGIHRMSWG